MDELNLSATFDISGLVDGMERAASTIKSGTDRISAAFEQASATSITALDALQNATTGAQTSVNNLASAQAAAGEVASTLASVERALADAKEAAVTATQNFVAASQSETATFGELTSAASAYRTTQAELVSLEGELVTVRAGAISALEALTTRQLEAAESLNILATAQERALAATAESDALAGGAVQLELLGTNAVEAAQALQGAAAETLALDEAIAAVTESLLAENGELQAVTAAVTATNEQFELFSVNIADIDTAVAEANGQLLLFTEAATNAAGQMSLFDTVAGGTAAAVANEGSAASAAAGVNAQLGAAIDFLTSAEGRAALAAEGLGLTLTDLVVAEDGATVATSNLGGMIGYASARLIAIEAGVGRLGYEFGILARAIPSVSTALSFIFPPLMLFVILDVVSSLIDRFEKLGETLRKTQVDFDNIAVSSEMMGTQIAIQTLKIEDQISKLEGGVAENKLDEAILETRLETEKLTKSLEDALEKAIELLRTDEITLWRSLVTGLDTTTDLKDRIQGLMGAIEVGLGQRALAYENLSAAERRLNDAETDEAEAAANRDIEQAKRDVTAADTSVRTNRDKLDAQLKQEQDHINELIRIRTTTQPIPGVRGTGPAFMTDEQARASVAANQAIVTSIQTLNTSQRNAEALDEERGEKQRELAGMDKAETEDRVRRWQASLNAMQTGLDAFHTFSTSSIIGFWNNILATETLTNKEREEISTKLAELQRRQVTETTRDITAAARDQALVARTTIDATTERVEAAKKALDDFNAAQAAAKPTVPGAPAPAGGLEVVVRPDVINERKKLEADLTAAIGAQEQARAVAAIRGIQEDYNAARRGSDERVRLAQQEVDTLMAQGRSGTEAGVAAEKQLTEAKKENSDARIKLAEEEARHTAAMQADVVEAQRAHWEATTTESIRRSNEGIDREQAYNDRIYEIQRARLEKDLEALKANSSATVAQITATQDKIDELQARHTAQRQANEDKKQADRMALENSVNATLERGIAGAITGMLTNYRNFQSALRGIYEGILADFATFLAKKIQRWIEHLILEKLWARIFGAQDTGTTPSDEAKEKIKANSATAMSDAAVAAANTLALDSMVELPPVPEAKAAVVYGLGLTFAGLAGAAAFQRGGITGEGLTPAILHPREMVLDSRLSEGMQNLILNSGSPAVQSSRGLSSSSVGATGGHTFNFPTHIGNLSAFDGASVKAVLEAHGDMIGKVAVAKVKSYFRSNGVIK